MIAHDRRQLPAGHRNVTDTGHSHSSLTDLGDFIPHIQLTKHPRLSPGPSDLRLANHQEVIEIIEQYKSGPTETDLLRLVHPYVVTHVGATTRRQDDIYLFSHYLEHVKRNGENGTITEFRKRVLDPD